MTRAEVVAQARRWLLVPYRHEGRSRAGVDCVGLLVVVGRALGVPHTDVTNYTGWADPQRRIFAEMDKFLTLRPADETDWDGTIGIFAEAALPCHAGIFSTQHRAPHVIHSRMSARRVVEEPYDPNPRNRPFRLLRRYGFPGLEA